MKHLLMMLVIGALVTVAGTAFAASANSSLGWVAPNTRMDGTPLQATEIAEYRVFYSVDGVPDPLGEYIVVSGAAVTSDVTLELVPRAEPYVVSFAVATVDTGGLVSPLSEVVSKQFDVDSTAVPGAPTGLIFSITCGEGCTITELRAGE